MRKTYTMTEEQYQALIEACRPVPYLVMNGVPPPDPQDNANAAWAQLGRELGFKPFTVEPAGRDPRSFTAEPVAVEEQTNA